MAVRWHRRGLNGSRHRLLVGVTALAVAASVATGVAPASARPLPSADGQVAQNRTNQHQTSHQQKHQQQRPQPTTMTAAQRRAQRGTVLAGPAHNVAVCATPRFGVRCLAQRRVPDHDQPAFNTSPTGGYFPADIQSAYNLAFAASASGVGRRVYLIESGDGPNLEADLGTYRSEFGLPPCTRANGCLQILNQSGQSSPLPPVDANWEVETSLDMDAVSAACPLCSITIMEANPGGLHATAKFAAENLGARIESLSFGGGEFSGEASAAANEFSQPGVIYVVSSGDVSYGPGYPKDAPDVIAAGGTTLRRDSSARGWSETAWSGAGSGCSTQIPQPAWQVGVTGCSMRADADVSAVADPGTGMAVYDSYQANGWGVVGGTSMSAPLIAGMYALAGYAPTTETTGAQLYSAPSGSLYDVVSGSTGPCPLFKWCNSGPGWDGPTGLGTPVGVVALRPPGSLAVNNPGSQTNNGTPIAIQITANDSNADPVSYTASGLPPGLSVSTTGTISGTPNLGGVYSVTVTGTDIIGYSSSVTFTWTVNLNVSVTVSATQTYGGSATFSSVTDRTNVTTHGATCTGLVGGTPISAALPAGTYTIDGATCSGAILTPAGDHLTGYQGGSLIVAEAPLTVLASSTQTNYGDPVPPITASYFGFVLGENESALTAAASCSSDMTPTTAAGFYPHATHCGGASSSNYTFSYVDGSATVLPQPVQVSVTGAVVAGQTIVFSGSTGHSDVAARNVTCGTVDGGTPITTGLAPGVHTVDAATCSADLSDFNHNIAGFDGTVSVQPFGVVTGQLPEAVVGKAYKKVTLAALGGKKAYHWSLTGGVLPPGMKLAASGAVTGTPTVVGTWVFSVTVTDSTKPANSATWLLWLTVDPLSVTTASLPDGTVGKAYKAALAANGGKAPLKWQIYAGALPPGLKLSTAGKITGKPTSGGSYTMYVSVTDKLGDTATAVLTISVP